MSLSPRSVTDGPVIVASPRETASFSHAIRETASFSQASLSLETLSDFSQALQIGYLCRDLKDRHLKLHLEILKRNFSAEQQIYNVEHILPTLPYPENDDLKSIRDIYLSIFPKIAEQESLKERKVKLKWQQVTEINALILKLNEPLDETERLFVNTCDLRKKGFIQLKLDATNPEKHEHFDERVQKELARCKEIIAKMLIITGNCMEF